MGLIALQTGSDHCSIWNEFIAKTKNVWLACAALRKATVVGFGRPCSGRHAAARIRIPAGTVGFW